MFDEQPDGDPHDECRHEITTLETALAAEREAVRVLAAEVRSWWDAMEVDVRDSEDPTTLAVHDNPIALDALEAALTAAPASPRPSPTTKNPNQ